MKKKQPEKALLEEFNNNLFTNTAWDIVKQKYGEELGYVPITMKMLLHDVVIKALDRADLLSGIVFHGGTCLQRMYNWTRFSEDLDFANVAKLEENRFIDFSREFGIAIKKELHKFGFSDEQISIKEPKNLKWPGVDEPEVRRWNMNVNVGTRGRKQLVKIELANMPSYEFSGKPFVYLSNALGGWSTFVNIEPLNVIFNDKLISVIQRNFLKFRDIYDIGFLVSQEHQLIDPVLFRNKMEDRNFSSDFVLERLQGKREQIINGTDDFINEMSRFIIPGVTCNISDQKIAESIISWAVSALDSISETLSDGPKI